LPTRLKADRISRVNRTYHYPATLRALALFTSLLAGGILLGSVIAEIEAADVPDAILHGVGAVAGLGILWLGLEFGMRRITPTREGISTRLLRERTIPWREVRDVRDGPFGVLIIQPKRGLPIVVWPYLEDFSALIEAVTNFRGSSTPSTS